jgi:hypothetical protein
MKKASKKLSVNLQTVRDLSAQDATQANGGTLLYLVKYDPVPEARPRCTAGYSGCGGAGR